MDITRVDRKWFVVYLVAVVIMFTGIIIQFNNTDIQKYGFLAFFSIGLLALAVAARGRLPLDYLLIGGFSRKRFFQAVALSLAVGFGFTAKYFGVSLDLGAIAIPQIVPAGTAIGLLVGISILVAELEETLRASIMYPSFKRILATIPVDLVLLVTGLAAYSLLNMQLIGTVLFLLSGLVFFGNVNLSSSPVLVPLGAKVASGLFFAGLHQVVYGTTPDGLLAVFVFAVVLDSINEYYKSTMPGRIVHVFNNAIKAAVVGGLGVVGGLVVVGLYVFSMFVVNEG